MKTWTSIEIEQLKNLCLEGVDDSEIASILGRTVNSIKCKKLRVVGSFIICKDCNVKVNNVKGKRLRCENCSSGI